MKTIILLLAVVVNFNSVSQTAPVDVLVNDLKGKPQIADKVYFVNQKTRASFSGVTNTSGKFHIELPSGAIYDIKIHSIGDELEYNTLEIPTIQDGEFFETAELIISYELPKSYTINNLQFESGQVTLKKESLSSLDDLIEYMKLKPNLKIEVAGHTDSDGEDQANLLLSQKRADTVKKYLISKGISTTRMTAKGYGETQPVESNSKESGKAKNRRTEIRIL